MGAAINLKGRRFERLLVLNALTKRSKEGQLMWRCLCDCGVRIVALGANLRKGHTRSCGCYHADVVTKHGHAQATYHRESPTYVSYRGMLDRCRRPSHISYPDYGGRGICVCRRWLPENNGFENFLADMGERPVGMTIDRQRVNGNYTPGNCRWATKETQARNKRRVLC